MTKRTYLAAGIAGFALIFSPASARAATLQWNGSTSDWGVSTAWSSPAGGVANATPAATDIAAFTDLAASPGTITVDAGPSGRSVGQLLFGTNTASVNAS